MTLFRWPRRSKQAAATRALLAATRRYLVPDLSEPEGLLAAGAAYWLAVDEAPDADWLVAQIAEAQSPGIEVGLITCGADGGRPSPSRVRQFRLAPAQAGAALRRLPSELVRARLDRVAIVVLSLPASAWDAFAPPELAAWCARLVDWLAAHGMTLVIVNRGTAEWAARIAAARFAGSALLYRDAGLRRYRVDAWHAPGGACADQDYALTAADAFVRIPRGGDAAPSAARAATGPVLVERGALDDAKALPAAWQVFDLRAELLAHAGTLPAATLVLGVHAAAGIEPLARALHQLRAHGGDGFAVVVRERIPDLGDLDRRLLTACGARLVVGFATPLDAFWELLRALRGRTFTPAADMDFDALRAGLRAPAASGVVAPAAFTDALAAVYAQAKPVLQHRLLRLVPRGRLGAARCLEQMTFARPGEFACVVADVVWLFLFGCDEEAEAPTLGRLCRLPATVLFGRLDLFTAADGIPAELAGAAEDSALPVAPAPAHTALAAPDGCAPPAPVRLHPTRLCAGGARG